MSRLEGNKGSQTNIGGQKKGKDKAANPQEQEQDKDSILQTWEEIEQIRRENKELRDEIKTEARMNNLNAPILVTKMEQIQELSSLFAQKIEVESQKKRDLELLKSISQEMINSNLKKMSQSNGIALPQLQVKIKRAEYSLEKTRSRHNESLAQINMLKEQVNMARRERVIFSNVFKKLESDIKLKDEEFKKYMIEKMQVDIKKKQLEEELQKIKTRAKKEVILFKNEYQQLFSQSKTQQQQQSNNESQDYAQKRIFDTEVILNEQTQINQNLNNSTMNNNSIISNNNNNISIINQNITNNNSSIMNQSQALNNKSPTSKHQTNTINLQVTQDELQKYQFMFQKLQKEVGIDDLDHLIFLFGNIEKENNDLYESANMKSDEIDQLKKQIKDVEGEIQKFSKHNDSKQKQSTIKDKKQQDLVKYKLKIDNLELMTKSVGSDISNVNSKLIKIAEKFNIPIPSQGENGEELDDASVIKFLQDVEARINDIINMSLYCEGKVINIDRSHDTQGTLTSLSKKGDNNSGIANVLDGVKKKSESESERILTKGDFSQISKDELKQFKDNKGKVPLSQKSKKQKV